MGLKVFGKMPISTLGGMMLKVSELITLKKEQIAKEVKRVRRGKSSKTLHQLNKQLEILNRLNAKEKVWKG